MFLLLTRTTQTLNLHHKLNYYTMNIEPLKQKMRKQYRDEVVTPRKRIMDEYNMEVRLMSDPYAHSKLLKSDPEYASKLNAYNLSVTYSEKVENSPFVLFYDGFNNSFRVEHDDETRATLAEVAKF